MAAVFEPIEQLRLLLRHQVEFIIVGGVAGNLAGSPLSTLDLDIVYNTSDGNLRSLVSALEELNAQYRDPAGRIIVPDQDKLATMKVHLLKTDLGNLDLLREVGDALVYEDLTSRSVEYDLEAFSVRALDVPALIATKTYADRPKDRYALPFLQELLRIDQQL